MRRMFVLPLVLAAFNLSATSAFSNDVWDIELNCPGERASDQGTGTSGTEWYGITSSGGRITSQVLIAPGSDTALIQGMVGRNNGFTGGRGAVTYSGGKPSSISFRDNTQATGCYGTMTRR